jgi:GT2 family glycosyltransferase
MFQEYLPQIRNRFPAQLHVVLEANEANLTRYDPSIVVAPYHGQKFLSEEMRKQLSEIVDLKQCAGVVIPWSNMDGAGFEHLMGFGNSLAPAPVHVIRPDLTIQQNSISGKASDARHRVLLEGTAECVYQTREGRLFICGWIKDHELRSLPLTISLDDVKCREKNVEIYRYPRPDITGIPPEKCLGYAIFASSSKKIPNSLSLHYSTGKTIAFGLEGKLMPPREMLNLALSIINLHQDCRSINSNLKKRLFDQLRHILVDISRSLGERVEVSEELTFGNPPAAPEASIIIPIYKAYDLLRHQMSSFVQDPFLKRQEIVCVLSSIEDADLNVSWFRLFCQRLFEIYGAPFRVLIPTGECSFSVACNLGAKAARSSRLLLLNSDVFPKSNGWLEAMIETLDANDSVAAVGARLLYPDDSIQHIGISWRRDSVYGHLFANVHPCKGMNNSLIPHQGVVPVPAVTAACMLVKKEIYIESGMLDTGYIRGDFEDSDFCLRMKKMGKEIMCDHRAELYHIEGISCASPLRSLLFRVNATRHMELWGTAIAEILHENG